MSKRILTILADPRMQRREIVVSQFFSVFYVVTIVQFDSVCATTTESVSWVHSHVLSPLFQLRPLAFPDDQYVLALISQERQFFHATLVDLLHCTVFQTTVVIITIALSAALPEAALELDHTRRW